MYTTHKISAELYFETFELLAVHTALDDYSLAYYLNKYLKLQLRRTKEDLNLKKMESFSIFEWMDNLSENYWTLFKNQSSQQHEGSVGGLFDNDKYMVTNYLISEKKEVDYFLKIQTEESDLVNSALNEINKIPNIVTAYLVNVDTLLSRKNLII